MESNEKRLGVLVATINEKIDRVVRSLLPQLSQCRVLVSHQVVDGFAYDKEASFVNQNVAYSQISSKGLAKNRNNCLKNMTQEINVIADDDVEYVPDFEKTILHEYDTHTDADVITFRVERGQHKTNEKQGYFVHDKWSIRKVPSIGITFRKSSIEKSGVTFDERFGIGSTYKSGEEAIFLQDCLSAGLKIMHVDVPIVRHTHLSSGWIWDTDQVKAKVAVMWRLYGPLWALIVPLSFTFSKHSLYSNHMGVIGYVSTVLRTYVRLLVRGLEEGK